MNRKPLFLGTGFIVLLALLAAPVWAASTKSEVLALKEEVASLKEGQAAIQNDLAEIKKLLEGGAKPAAAAPAPKGFEPQDINIGSSPVLGDADAPVTMVEYSDYQCPFCRRHYTDTHAELVKQYVDTGKIKIVMREFPLISIHPRAVPASTAALCAGEQGKYWEMHDMLFENQRQLSDEDLLGYGTALGLNASQFDDCFTSGEQAKQIESDLAAGREVGVRGTPSFVLGLTNSSDPDEVNVTKFFSGARSFDSFAKEIDELLAESDSAASP